MNRIKKRGGEALAKRRRHEALLKERKVSISKMRLQALIVWWALRDH